MERANQSIQSLLYKYMTHNEVRRWEDALDMLVDTYNGRIHRTIGLSPNSAELPINANRVASALREHYSKAITRQIIKYKVGDKVRLKTGYGMAFPRGFEEQFSRELYKICGINKRMGRVMYRLRSMDSNKIIAGCAYPEELQLVKGDVYRFTVLERKTVRNVPMMKIHYRGFSSRHDVWVRADMPVVDNFHPLPQQLRRDVDGRLPAGAVANAGDEYERP